MIYKNLVRPLLFRLQAESAHNFAKSCIDKGGFLLPLLRRYLVYRSRRLENSVAGLAFLGPTGMAAGFDKNAVLYSRLLQLGFDFVECGTFTSRKQEGNSLPRLFRLAEQKALINHMGFNNPGAEKAAQNLSQQTKSLVRGINIGKSKNTPLEKASADYLYSVRKLAPFADYITVNISSPNTPDLAKLQKEKKLLKELLDDIQSELASPKARPQKESTDRQRPPLFVKLGPDLSLKELDTILEILIETKAAGLVLSNTSTDRNMLQESIQKKGGLSGRPIREKSTSLIRHCFRQAGEKLAIIGVGGIDSGEAALEKILAGASLIQLYTGYIYEGPLLPAKINHYIDAFLQREKLNISEIIGAEA